MKKILTIITLFLTTIMFSQFSNEEPYPRYEIDSLGQKVVVMTIPQAMKLNNNSNLLEGYIKLASEMVDYETMFIKVVNEKDEVIKKLEVVVSKQTGQMLVKDQKIETLQNEIIELNKKNLVLTDQVTNREKVKNELQESLNKANNKILFGGISGGVIIVGTILLAVFGVL